MRRLLIAALVLGMTAVYEPNSIIPKYYVKESPQGESRVYDSRQIVIPKYIVKPDSTGKYYRVYEAGKPILPIYHIEKRGAKHWLNGRNRDTK